MNCLSDLTQWHHQHVLTRFYYRHIRKMPNNLMDMFFNKPESFSNSSKISLGLLFWPSFITLCSSELITLVLLTSLHISFLANSDPFFDSGCDYDRPADQWQGFGLISNVKHILKSVTRSAAEACASRPGRESSVEDFLTCAYFFIEWNFCGRLC